MINEIILGVLLLVTLVLVVMLVRFYQTLQKTPETKTQKASEPVKKDEEELPA